MAAKFFWFLPTNGDSRSIVALSHTATHQSIPNGYRPASRRYLAEVARAADRLGFEGVLTPTGTFCEDAWLSAAALLSETERLKFLVAFRPGLVPPTLAAQQAATLQRFSDGRLLLNVVSGGEDAEQQRFGDWLDHDQRYARTAEFVKIVKDIWTHDSVDFDGDHYRIRDGRVSEPPNPLPQLYFGGSSPAALPIAAQYMDSYLTWGERPADVAKKVADVKARAAKHGRTVKFGIRLHVIVRETEEEAWADADRLISRLDDEVVSKAQAAFARMDSEGQRRMAALHAGGAKRSRADLEISPNLWAGVGLVRGGAGTALVGNPQQVAARIQEYADLGLENFIFSGYPHLEEAYRFAELVFPLLPRRVQQKLPGKVLTGPFGEAVANVFVPRAAQS